MSTYNEIDIQVTPSGDLSLSSDGGFALISASGVLKQDVTFRVRTNRDEFEPHPDVGADLDEIIGEPNTRETAGIGNRKIQYSLTSDGMVRDRDLSIRGVPIALDKVVYYVFIRNGTEQLNVTPDVVFSASNGLVNIPGNTPTKETNEFLMIDDGSILMMDNGNYIPI